MKKGRYSKPSPSARRSEQSHALTLAERGRGGLVRLVRLYRGKYEQAEARVVRLAEQFDARLREREEELARLRRTVEHVSRPEPVAPSRQVPPAQPADVPAAGASQARSGLSVAEQDAINRGLTGPPWWADTEALDARREARRRARFDLNP